MSFSELDEFMRRTGLRLQLRPADSGTMFLCLVCDHHKVLVTGIGETSREAAADAITEVRRLLS